MRLLFLSNSYPPYHIGGYEELCAEVAHGLKQRGHTVAVLTSSCGADGTTNDEDGVYRFLHPEVDWRPYRATLSFFVGRQRRLQENLTRFEQTVAQFQPGILLAWGMWNLPRQLLALAESWEHPKVVYYIADYWPTLPNAYTLHWREPARRWYTWLPKLVLSRIAFRMLACKDQTPELKLEHAICVSQAVRQRLSDASLPLTSAKVIYNGIDLAPFLATRKLRVQRRRTDALALLYAGRLSPDKGVHTAIEAIARLAHQGYMVTLIILGGGSRDYEAELHRLCRRLGVSDRVMFRGRVPRAQMPEVLSQFDVLVFPAIGPESLPRIVQEAMAAGLAVVGTEVGGMSEILVNGVNGLTFTPGDAHELAMRVEQLILDPNLHSQLAKAGQHTVRERFDIRRMLDEIEVYLQRVVAG